MLLLQRFPLLSGAHGCVQSGWWCWLEHQSQSHVGLSFVSKDVLFKENDPSEEFQVGPGVSSLPTFPWPYSHVSGYSASYYSITTKCLSEVSVVTHGRSSYTDVAWSLSVALLAWLTFLRHTFLFAWVTSRRIIKSPLIHRETRTVRYNGIFNCFWG